jgi:hypothetical protein
VGDEQLSIISGRKFGRFVNHDPRSRGYQAKRRMVTSQSPTFAWALNAPILDQKELGSCTGNALAQCLNTVKFRSSRPGSGNPYLTEYNAIQIYSLGTQLDEDPENYPPVDTGCDGLSACKAGVRFGYLKGYTHAFGFDHFRDALRLSPVIVGTNWYSEMMAPNTAGLLKVKGYSVGGHEYLCVGDSPSRELLKFANSWGGGWGKKGFFYLSYKDFTRLLDEEGDVTIPIGK